MPRPRTALLLFLVALFAGACATMDPIILGAPSPDAAPTPTPFPGAMGDELTFMSYNVRYSAKKDGAHVWPNRKEAAFGILNTYQPDVVGMQEPLQRQLDQFLTRFPGYREVGNGRLNRRVAILYKSSRVRVDEFGIFWFSDTPDVKGSKGWGNDAARMCTWARMTDRRTGQPFYIYNVHLDHASDPSRRASVELLARRITTRKHPGLPVVITGDFNASEKSPVIQFMKGKTDRTLTTGPPPPSIEFVDSFRVAQPGATDVGTFHGFRGTTTGPKIDFVFVEGDTTVVEAAICRDRVGGVYPSDHFPVVARVVLR